MFPNSNFFKLYFQKGKVTGDLKPNWNIVDAAICDFDKSFGSYRADSEDQITWCEGWGLW